MRRRPSPGGMSRRRSALHRAALLREDRGPQACQVLPRGQAAGAATATPSSAAAAVVTAAGGFSPSRRVLLPLLLHLLLLACWYPRPHPVHQRPRGSARHAAERLGHRPAHMHAGKPQRLANRRGRLQASGVVRRTRQASSGEASATTVKTDWAWFW